MVYKADLNTGKVNFETKETVQSDEWRFGISMERANKILVLAVADGYKPDAETAQGQKGQNTRAMVQYINLALDKLFAVRAADLAPKAAVKKS